MRYVALIVLLLPLAGCGSAEGNYPQPSSSPVSANITTCDGYGLFLQNQLNDVQVVDLSQGVEPISAQDDYVAASPTLQALIAKWDVDEQAFEDNNMSNETTGPAVEKTDRRLAAEGQAIESWCGAHAGVNPGEVTYSP